MSSTIAPSLASAETDHSPAGDESTTVPITISTQSRHASRTRKRSAQSEGSPDDNKKQRGRPRVEPKDETAADRRRTQIRLAQRTYRARKESTISFLEDKVASLEDTVQRRDATLNDLHRLAISSGVDKTAPLLFQALASATQNALQQSGARRSAHRQRRAEADQSASGSNGAADYPSSSSTETQRLTPPPSEGRSSVDESLAMVTKHLPQVPAAYQPTIVSPAQRGVPSVWGYEMIYDPNQQAMSMPSYGYPAYPGSEVSQNMYGPIQQQYPLPQEQIQMMHAQQAPPPRLAPEVELNLPKSYSYHERTFGRTLYRRCLEWASHLLDHPDRNRRTIDVVFAHGLQHSTLEAIRGRLNLRLKRTQTDSLDVQENAQAPSRDEKGLWLKPEEVDGYLLAKRNLHLNPLMNLAECETEEEVMPSPHSWGTANGQHPHGPDGDGGIGGVYATPMAQWNGSYGAGGWGQISGPVRQKRRVTIDVQRFLENLVQYSRCRGQTPALLDKDVDAAFQQSVVQPVSSY